MKQQITGYMVLVVFVTFMTPLFAENGTEGRSEHTPEKKENGKQKRHSLPDDPSESFIGKLKNKSTLRIAPRSSASSLETFEEGTLLLVQYRKNEWYRIRRTTDVELWISEEEVQSIDDDLLEVTGRNVSLYLRPGYAKNKEGVTTTTLSARLRKKGKKKVNSEQGERTWYRVEVPDYQSTWISADDVEYAFSNTLENRRKLPGQIGKDATRTWNQKTYGKRLEEIVSDVSELFTQDLSETSFDRMINRLKSFEESCPIPYLAERAGWLRNKIEGAERVRQKEVRKLRQRLKNIQEMREVLKGTRSRLKKVEIDESGYMESYGNVISRPADFVLKKGGEILLFLKGAGNIHLKPYLFKYVGVRGELKTSGDQQDIFVVEEIEVLE